MPLPSSLLPSAFLKSPTLTKYNQPLGSSRAITSLKPPAVVSPICVTCVCVFIAHVKVSAALDVQRVVSNSTGFVYWKLPCLSAYQYSGLVKSSCEGPFFFLVIMNNFFLFTNQPAT